MLSSGERANSYDAVSRLHSLAFEIRGALDVHALRDACWEVMWRHEVLQSCFPDVASPSAPVYRCGSDALRGAVTVREVSGEWDRRAFLEALHAPMDLENGPLFRVIIEGGADLWLFGFAFERIIADEISVHEIWTEEISAAYEARVTNGEPTSIASACQYYDHAAWQRARLDFGREVRLVEQWRSELEDMSQCPPLQVDEFEPFHENPQSEVVEAVPLGAQLSTALSAAMQNRRAAAREVWLTALTRATARLNAATSVSVITPIEGRSSPESRHLMGCFGDVTALKVPIKPGESFARTLGRVEYKMLEAPSRSAIPFRYALQAVATTGPFATKSRAPYLFLDVLPQVRTVDLSLAGLQVFPIGGHSSSERKWHADVNIFPREKFGGWDICGTFAQGSYSLPDLRRLLGQMRIEVSNWLILPEWGGTAFVGS
ncbi:MULTISPECIES: condensation domain-containing protein [Streptomyces]|uniref:condensation domain-containing protein n=1 Tax=Streptomyces TaxID=1883 RepID=UPI00131DC515|nr:condensation domain-containing protein [Streptomyces virginiae]